MIGHLKLSRDCKISLQDGDQVILNQILRSAVIPAHEKEEFAHWLITKGNPNLKT